MIGLSLSSKLKFQVQFLINICFLIGNGQKGEKGEQGETGVGRQGPQGDTGATGPRGEKGESYSGEFMWGCICSRFYASLMRDRC